MKKLLLISLPLLVIPAISLFFARQYLLSQIYPVPSFDTPIEIDNGIIISVPIGTRKAHGVFIVGDEQLVVLLHGNGSSLHEMIPVVYHLSEPGFSVLLIEYPGYWLSKESKTDEASILQDSKELINYIVHQYGYTNNKITLLGYSLGGAVAISLASQGIGSKVITVDTFTSMDDLISQVLPRKLAEVINTEKFDNITTAKLVNQPVLILHGDKDDYIPYGMSQKLKSVFNNADLIMISSSNHATVLNDISDDIWVHIIKFIKSGKI